MSERENSVWCWRQSCAQGSVTRRCKIDGESHVDDDDERLFLFPHTNNNLLNTRNLYKLLYVRQKMTWLIIHPHTTASRMYNLASYMGLDLGAPATKACLRRNQLVAPLTDGRTRTLSPAMEIGPSGVRPADAPVHSTCLLRDFALQTSSFHSCSVPDRSHEAGLFNLKRSHWSNQYRCPGWIRLIRFTITAFSY